MEIELTGLDVREIAAAVADAFQGRVRLDNDYLAHVDSELGEFRVEADLALLQEIGRRRVRTPDDAGLLARARDVVAEVAEVVAPYEVVAPPIPIHELPQLDELVGLLGKRGGRGTRIGTLQALGLQLNPDVPAQSAASIHAHLRAFAVLAPWLRKRRGVDWSRRVSTFVDPYPEPYVRLLLEQSTAPPIEQVIGEYLSFNPTRNRSLDMLPLFAHMDAARVKAVVDDPRIKSRPTFHYRLPDSRVGEPGWRVTDEWRHWLVVERVAANPAALEALCAAYASALDSASWWALGTEWPDVCERMLQGDEYGTRAPISAASCSNVPAAK